MGEIQLTVVDEKPLFKNLSVEEQQYRLEQDLGSKFLEGTLNLDTGLCVLFATDQGNLHGLSFFDKLLDYDRRLQKLTKHLNQQRIPLKSCKKYLLLSQDIRGYIKNEVQRNIKRLVSTHHPSRIVIDQLNFSNSHLSRRMNRILRNCGLSVIRKKLASLTEEYGIEITYVNPAFTSQECSHCGYIDKKNRQGRKFQCLLCGCRLHADVNGARNHKSRSSRTYPHPITVDTRKKTVLEILIQQFFVQLKSFQWLSRLRSKAKVLILSNPYFKDYWEDVAKGLLVVWKVIL